MNLNQQLCRQHGIPYVPPAPPALTAHTRIRPRLIGPQGWIAIAAITAGLLTAALVLAVMA
ncbi:MAG: hypothetical protein J0H79_14165 [Alphaproteobacteria bacterium]|nr:hypothetical protein [Alphaproteobacteria bacterium]